MKRLIIIGNGFDLAHKRKTSYSDFLCYYWNNIKSNYDDDLFSIKTNYGVINSCNSFGDLQKEAQRINLQWLSNDMVEFNFKNKFFHLLNNLSTKNPRWVDIEMHYYDQLSILFKRKEFGGIAELNKEFEIVKNTFEKYIIQIVTGEYKKPIYNPDIGALFEPYAPKTERLRKLEDQLEKEGLDSIKQMTDSSTRSISHLHIINFNYTDTLELYYEDIKKNKRFTINHIHGVAGDIENPIVFGFGDERDSLYNELENANDNEYLRFMKSSFYLKTRNYFDLQNFISSGAFIVEIIGHSCALSDRTLLKSIFEHPNCKYIQMHFHQREESDNFHDLSLNISRHFDNKIQLRQKVANKKFCDPLPQNIN